MTTTVLAYLPSPSQGVWHLGPVPIRAYALCIIVGIVAALVIGDRRWQARGGEPGVIYDIALWAVPFGLAGGRIYHVITDWKTYFGPTGKGFGAALQIWEGGLGIWGAVAFGAVGAWIACRLRGIPLPAFGDAIAPGIILAQGIGRLGNYFNQELYGRPTDVPWGLEIYERLNKFGQSDQLNGVSTGQVTAVVHPTFLYELIWNIAVFGFLIWVDRKFRIGHGRLFALYVASYCVGRFWVELMRSDTATEFAGIRVNTFTSTFVFIGAVVYIMLAPKGREEPESLRGKAADETEEGDEESLVDEAGKELVAAAAGTGVVAAATAAAREDTDDTDGTTDPAAASDEPGDEAEPETEAATAVLTADGAEAMSVDEQPDDDEAVDEEADQEAEEPADELVELADEPEGEPEPAAAEEAEPAETIEPDEDEIFDAELAEALAEAAEDFAVVPESAGSDEAEVAAAESAADADGPSDAESAEVPAEAAADDAVVSEPAGTVDETEVAEEAAAEAADLEFESYDAELAEALAEAAEDMAVVVDPAETAESDEAREPVETDATESEEPSEPEEPEAPDAPEALDENADETRAEPAAPAAVATAPVEPEKGRLRRWLRRNR